MDELWTSDWILGDGLGILVVIAPNTGGRAVERSGYSDWLLLDLLVCVVAIAAGYWWTGWGS